MAAEQILKVPYWKEGVFPEKVHNYDGSKLSMLGRKDSMHSSFDGELSRMSSRESQGSSDERKHNLSGMYGMFLKF